MSTIVKYRVTHATGYREFADEADAEAWRDANHPGAQIAEVSEDTPSPDVFVPWAVWISRLTDARRGQVLAAIAAAPALATIHGALERGRAIGGVTVTAPETLAMASALVSAGVLTQAEADLLTSA